MAGSHISRYPVCNIKREKNIKLLEIFIKKTDNKIKIWYRKLITIKKTTFIELPKGKLYMKHVRYKNSSLCGSAFHDLRTNNKRERLKKLFRNSQHVQPKNKIVRDQRKPISNGSNQGNQYDTSKEDKLVTWLFFTSNSSLRWYSILLIHNFFFLINFLIKLFTFDNFSTMNA